MWGHNPVFVQLFRHLETRCGGSRIAHHKLFGRWHRIESVLDLFPLLILLLVSRELLVLLFSHAAAGLFLRFQHAPPLLDLIGLFRLDLCKEFSWVHDSICLEILLRKELWCGGPLSMFIMHNLLDLEASWDLITVKGRIFTISCSLIERFCQILVARWCYRKLCISGPFILKFDLRLASLRRVLISSARMDRIQILLRGRS